MSPTLASLVQHSSLRLAVLAGEDRLDVPVRWAQVSELPDPTPWLDGGELLLMTALKIDAADPETMRGYLRRLSAAGVVGLGFAAGVNYEQVPDALVEAAREADFPLLEVPRRTPFIAIAKAVSAAIAAEQYRSVTAGFEAQRELTRAAQSAEGPEVLLARLAAHVDGWAALYDASGSLVSAAPAWAARRAGRLVDDVVRLHGRQAPASAVVSGSEADDRVELQTVGGGRRARAVLAVGTGSPLGTAERYAVNSAVALLTLTTERSRALHDAEQRLSAAVLRMLLSGEDGHARAVAGNLYGTLLDTPLRVVVAETAPQSGAEPPDPEAPGPLEALADAVESAASRGGESVLAVPDGSRLVLLVADGGGGAAACAAHARGAEGLAVGVSAPTGIAAATTAYKQAEQALSIARRRGASLVEHEEMAAGSVLPLLADDAVRAFAGGLLRPLHEHDASGRGDLVASLRAWLSRHGQWDAAAADLGVHRHTLRYRMRRVEEILGRSLDDPDARMELWLALKATHSAEPDRSPPEADGRPRG
ncbi:PucR family transcriptional regulator ligand-binding domain-containing protein [Streptomyces durbertensis]|uniref:PucR family transcriptional regulator ligand-binding domain-containing protein n=1 Tax=Streptomyces durbertensis TaxID=2448886 RepID=A0ABR6EEQ7_9ACTN|nr:PucR family transcriptional regulator ligand-binding domain-containing protein [Streptomyces durbertensis]MBB1242969.1 PucR family transcriptional regulator ligand-binding domain-containing protein [Streptomyces durbertensis]